MATPDEQAPRSAPSHGEREGPPARYPSAGSGGTASTFRPRVEAEEGDPTRGDFVVGALVALAVVLGILWACGVIPIR